MTSITGHTTLCVSTAILSKSGSSQPSLLVRFSCGQWVSVFVCQSVFRVWQRFEMKKGEKTVSRSTPKAVKKEKKIEKNVIFSRFHRRQKCIPEDSNRTRRRWPRSSRGNGTRGCRRRSRRSPDTRQSSGQRRSGPIRAPTNLYANGCYSVWIVFACRLYVVPVVHSQWESK